MNRTCRRLQRSIALLAEGELGRSRAARTRRHLAACAACRSLQAELTEIRGLVAGLRLDEAEMDSLGFRPVGAAVRAHLAAPAAAPARPPGLAAVLTSVAATMLAAAFLLAGRGSELAPPTARQAEPVAALNVYPGEDAGATVLALEPTPVRVHRVAVSRQSDDFREAQIFEVQGSRWVDPTPLPEPGQVVFYRID